ncbi:MAG: hypothetical protein HQL35_12440 [Alphaproteobacteria bacterium]|nr:hypothetical protein [Alphaproteobacteria bacterium]
MRVVILTGSELRHSFLRKAFGLADGIEVLLSVCEGEEKSLRSRILRQKDDGLSTRLREMHVTGREQSEQDFFSSFVSLTPDRSNPLHIPKGDVNTPEMIQRIEELNPDLLLCYSSSLIRGSLLRTFKGRFLNVHLGLSPYYRGSGTNLWPLINGEPEYVGATFMHIDEGIDTGEIIHQIRARVIPGDSPHQIGNRLISDMVAAYIELVRNFKALQPMGQLPIPESARLYKRNDFVEESLERLYANLESGMISAYLRDQEARDAGAPILVNPGLAGGGA